MQSCRKGYSNKTRYFPCFPFFIQLLFVFTERLTSTHLPFLYSQRASPHFFLRTSPGRVRVYLNLISCFCQYFIIKKGLPITLGSPINFISLYSAVSASSASAESSSVASASASSPSAVSASAAPPSVISAYMKCQYPYGECQDPVILSLCSQKSL